MVKYVVRAKIEVEGEVDKSDIIGAIFGYTEGIFGEEFDLRELQDKGRLGRISVDVKTQNGKTVGEILIPSNLDRVETALIGALLENVERVGPYQARIQIVDIVDVRAERIKRIMERASELARKYFVEKAPDLKEILIRISENIRIAEVTSYGPEKLPAGPDVDKSDTIIIVEGRADVVNMLKYGYRNVIALEGAHGAKVPESIIRLASKKTAILFIDGDRAGELIAREVLKHADIDYIAKAPVGREVEELTGKEIAKALKNAIPAKQFLEQLEKRSTDLATEMEKPPQPETVIQQLQQVVEKREEEVLEVPMNVIEEGKKLIGNLEALLYDSQWSVVEKVSVRDLVEKLDQMEYGKIRAIIFDGIITQRLLDVASNKGVKLIIGVRLGNINKKPENLTALTFNDILGTLHS